MHDKKMVYTLVAIQGDKRGTFFSGAELITDSNETVANTKSLLIEFMKMLRL